MQSLVFVEHFSYTWALHKAFVIVVGYQVQNHNQHMPGGSKNALSPVSIPQKSVPDDEPSLSEEG